MKRNASRATEKYLFDRSVSLMKAYYYFGRLYFSRACHGSHVPRVGA